MFKEQLGRTMKVYIDDLVVKSKEKHVYLANLAETFSILLKDKMKLNASKCASDPAKLNSITSPWSFAQWGLHIVGPLLRALGNKGFLIVATNYFTKWIEAAALTHIRDVDVKSFVWKNIITRFGIPRALVSDNGTQFDCGVYRELCNKYGIRPYFSSSAYPRSNGQVEASNKVILDGIKKRLERRKAGGLKRCPVCCGLITPLRGNLLEKRRSLCDLGHRLLSLLKLACPH
ncbi:uncharacterized protein LOC114277450 [Camellia sinensis]|uniref:uncharacterized protein LOC114277450 n=1 Tax=Camellia sinensis TaxID=4442 RepID=UPI0010365A04|nr:uncharacterized protein LOC114277450 [Camellia sinensis]